MAFKWVGTMHWRGAACIESRWGVRAVAVAGLARERESVYDMHCCQVLAETPSCLLKVVCKHNL